MGAGSSSPSGSSRIFDDHGQRLGVYGTIQDITERSQLEAEERALRRVSELVAENAGAAAVFGAVASEVQRLFSAHTGFVSRFDLATGIGTVMSSHRADTDVVEELTFDLRGQTASAAVARTGRPARVDAITPTGLD